MAVLILLLGTLLFPVLTEARSSANVTPTPANSNSSNSSTNSCVMAEPYPNSMRKCTPYYFHASGFCNNTIPPGALIYSAGHLEQRAKEDEFKTFTFRSLHNSLHNGYPFFKQPYLNHRRMSFLVKIMNSACFKIIRDVYCHHYFPLCDTTARVVRRRVICRTTCEEMIRRCGATWSGWMRRFPGVTWKAQNTIGSDGDSTLLMNCLTLPDMSHPDTADCLYSKLLFPLNKKTPYRPPGNSHHRKHGSIPNLSCYRGNGYTYRGRVNWTLTGLACQAWSKQCPHRHTRTPDNYQELNETVNACRNPGNSSAVGPWCYTTDTRVRWEYCDIRKCPQHNTRVHVKRSHRLPLSAGSKQSRRKKQTKRNKRQKKRKTKRKTKVKPGGSPAH